MLNWLIVYIAVASALLLFSLGTILGLALLVRPKLDIGARWVGFVPLSMGSALAILALALAKWATSIL